jgi:4-hydroxyphenylpyruvate dioxygenase
MTAKLSDTMTREEQFASLFEEIDYVEFYVGNARQAEHYFRTAYGFRPVAYTGLETGLRDRASFLVEQGGVRFIITAPLGPDGHVAEHVRRHGDGVRDIAFAVEDVEAAFAEAVMRGARPIEEPAACESENGRLMKATIGVFGDTIHTLIERENGATRSLPDFRALEDPPPARGVGLHSIDHIAITVESGQLDRWVGFYKHGTGFHQSHQEDVATEYSGMNSKVVQNHRGRIKFPIMEPAQGRRRSQIEEYLAFYGGPGAQHLAVATDDILSTVKALRANGVEFLSAPDSYYETLEQRVGWIEEDVAELREQRILVDLDETGYLMQIFTKPLGSRPTIFLEIIQRKGARGFGGGNIKALFEAVEREQARRGNL